jgi:L-aminopeptidase/D-esterase-like protein
MMRPGPRNLITDVAGLRVGNAADPRLKSGVTVLTADAPFVAGVDVRGGRPGRARPTCWRPAGRSRRSMRWRSPAARPSGSTRRQG